MAYPNNNAVSDGPASPPPPGPAYPRNRRAFTHTQARPPAGSPADNAAPVTGGADPVYHPKPYGPGLQMQMPKTPTWGWGNTVQPGQGYMPPQGGPGGGMMRTDQVYGNWSPGQGGRGPQVIGPDGQNMGHTFGKPVDPGFGFGAQAQDWQQRFREAAAAGFRDPNARPYMIDGAYVMNSQIGPGHPTAGYSNKEGYYDSDRINQQYGFGNGPGTEMPTFQYRPNTTAYPNSGGGK